MCIQESLLRRLSVINLLLFILTFFDHFRLQVEYAKPSGRSDDRGGRDSSYNGRDSRRDSTGGRGGRY